MLTNKDPDAEGPKAHNKIEDTTVLNERVSYNVHFTRNCTSNIFIKIYFYVYLHRNVMRGSGSSTFSSKIMTNLSTHPTDYILSNCFPRIPYSRSNSSTDMCSVNGKAI